MGAIYDKTRLEDKSRQYSSKHNTIITQMLGSGTQGIVYKSDRNTAIKVYDLVEGYKRERSIYQRLEERRIFEIRGLKVPRLHNFNDELLIIEMSIVHVPCLLDFGGAYLDTKPDHISRDENWENEKSEEFGTNWEEAKAVIREIEYRGDIWLSDVNNGNIKFSVVD